MSDGFAAAALTDGELTLLARMLALVASREPLLAVLNELLKFAEQIKPDMRCSILVADAARGVLRSSAAPSLPAAYVRATDGLPIGEGFGSCGTAAARRTPVIVSDISQSPLWRNYAVIAAEHRLAACWSLPILATDGELLGTMGMYYERPRVPTPAEEDLSRFFGGLVALVMQRDRDAARLHASEARYRLLAEACPDAVFVHGEGSILYANQAAAQLLLLPDAASVAARPLVEFVCPESRPALLAHRHGMLAARLQRADGAIVAVEVSATRINLDERPRTLLICRDVTERLSLEHELLDVASRERTRLAHDLHDGLGQRLTGIALYLRGLTNQVVPQLPALAQEFLTVNQLVCASIEETRLLAAGMSPLSVQRGGLAGALNALAAQAQTQYGVVVHTDLRSVARVGLDDARAEHLYRIAQEAVSNVGRHSGASNLRIMTERDGATFSLIIDDDGAGLADVPRGDRRAEGLGLRIMRYRAERIGGTLSVAPGRLRGTVVCVRCPVPLAAGASERGRAGGL